MLSDLSSQDRLRLMKFVCSFAWADLEIRPEERVFVAQMVRRLELEEPEANHNRPIGHGRNLYRAVCPSVNAHRRQKNDHYGITGQQCSHDSLLQDSRVVVILAAIIASTNSEILQKPSDQTWRSKTVILGGLHIGGNSAALAFRRTR